jgi:hypothetical protein
VGRALRGAARADLDWLPPSPASARVVCVCVRGGRAFRGAARADLDWDGGCACRGEPAGVFEPRVAFCVFEPRVACGSQGESSSLASW